MTPDLTSKYRPVFFRDFWSQSGAVEIVAAFVASQSMPKSLLLLGDYGTGKTSLARVAGRAVSCHTPRSFEPCGDCDGCRFPSTLLLGDLGSVVFVPGNRFSMDRIRRIIRDVDPYSAPEPSGIYLVIIDEAQRLSPKDQEALIDVIEDTSRTHFIFCTTHEHHILDAIRSRSHRLEMELPTVEEAVEGLANVATREGITIEENVLKEISQRRNRNPRGCLKDLQLFRALGSIPKRELHQEKDGALF